MPSCRNVMQLELDRMTYKCQAFLTHVYWRVTLQLTLDWGAVETTLPLEHLFLNDGKLNVSSGCCRKRRDSTCALSKYFLACFPVAYFWQFWHLFTASSHLAFSQFCKLLLWIWQKELNEICSIQTRTTHGFLGLLETKYLPGKFMLFYFWNASGGVICRERQCIKVFVVESNVHICVLLIHFKTVLLLNLKWITMFSDCL